jgi:hypothetical protein
MGARPGPASGAVAAAQGWWVKDKPQPGTVVHRGGYSRSCRTPHLLDSVDRRGNVDDGRTESTQCDRVRGMFLRPPRLRLDRTDAGPLVPTVAGHQYQLHRHKLMETRYRTLTFWNALVAKRWRRTNVNMLAISSMTGEHATIDREVNGP